MDHLLQNNNFFYALGAVLLVLIAVLVLSKRRRARAAETETTVLHLNDAPSSTHEQTTVSHEATHIDIAPASVSDSQADGASPVELPYEQTEAELRNLLSRKPYDAAVIGSREPTTRRAVSAALLAVLADESSKEFELARTAFFEHGHFEDLAATLKQASSVSDRATAARNIGLLGAREGTPHLVKALFDLAPDVRSAAVRSLGQIKDPAAIKPLKDLLGRETDRHLPVAVIRHVINSIAVAQTKRSNHSVTDRPEIVQRFNVESQHAVVDEPAQLESEPLAPMVEAVDETEAQPSVEQSRDRAIDRSDASDDASANDWEIVVPGEEVSSPVATDLSGGKQNAPHVAESEHSDQEADESLVIPTNEDETLTEVNADESHIAEREESTETVEAQSDVHGTLETSEELTIAGEHVPSSSEPTEQYSAGEIWADELVVPRNDNGSEVDEVHVLESTATPHDSAEQEDELSLPENEQTDGRQQFAAEAKRRLDEELRNLEEARRIAEEQQRRMKEELRKLAEESEQRLKGLEELRREAEKEEQRRTEQERRIKDGIDALRLAEKEQRERIEAETRRRDEMLAQLNEKLLPHEASTSRPVDVVSEERPTTAQSEDHDLVPEARNEKVSDTSFADLSDPVADTLKVTLEIPDNVEPAPQLVERTKPSQVELTPKKVERDALHPRKTPANVEALLQRLNTTRANERAAVLVELGRAGSEAAFQHITNAFDDPAADVRNAAARALYEVETDRAASFTRALRESSQERARRIGAAIAASGLATDAVSNLLGDNRKKTYDAFSILFLMAKAGEIQPLIKTIEDHPNLDTRLAVLKLLTLSDQPAIASALRRLMTRTSLPPQLKSALNEAINQVNNQIPEGVLTTA